MVILLSVIFIFLGTLLLTFELYIPMPVEQYGMVVMNHILGLVFLILGLIVLGFRIKATGCGGMIDLPREDRIQCFTNPGYSKNTKILKGVLLDNNLIKAGDKLFHYRGGGFRIAGHECVRVQGNVAANIPEWLGETLARYKTKYGIDDHAKLMKLYKNLQQLNHTEEIDEQLRRIPELANIVDDEEKMGDLCNMRLKDIKSMAETIWDGTTIRLEPDIEEFIQTATPANIYQYAQKEYISKKNRDKMLKSQGSYDIAKYAIPIGVLLFMAALGMGIFLQMG